jgi:hypothetical protein
LERSFFQRWNACHLLGVSWCDITWIRSYLDFVGRTNWYAIYNGSTSRGERNFLQRRLYGYGYERFISYFICDHQHGVRWNDTRTGHGRYRWWFVSKLDRFRFWFALHVRGSIRNVLEFEFFDLHREWNACRYGWHDADLRRCWLRTGGWNLL